MKKIFIAAAICLGATAFFIMKPSTSKWKQSLSVVKKILQNDLPVIDHPIQAEEKNPASAPSSLSESELVEIKRDLQKSPSIMRRKALAADPELKEIVELTHEKVLLTGPEKEKLKRLMEDSALPRKWLTELQGLPSTAEDRLENMMRRMILIDSLSYYVEHAPSQVAQDIITEIEKQIADPLDANLSEELSAVVKTEMEELKSIVSLTPTLNERKKG